ncbi:MAG: hypothetical protein SFV55_24375, partial [Haliscomenobacter sp.]|uniref:hypothetical protein n=1 Tax=Haliscomenobacter sp. TaxID=2717303 RepID=UPI0029A889CE
HFFSKWCHLVEFLMSKYCSLNELSLLGLRHNAKRQRGATAVGGLVQHGNMRTFHAHIVKIKQEYQIFKYLQFLILLT